MGHPTTLEHLGEIMGGTFYKHETTRSYAAIKPRKETAYSFGILCGVGTGLTLKRTASLTFGKSVSCENQFQDWEDSHGEVRKKVLQQVLLPHEIVGNFAAIGESYRMIGHTVPCQKISAMQPLPSKFGGCVCFPPKKTRFYSKDLKQFWQMERATKWFQEHPILSETWSKIQFRSSVSRDFLFVILIQKTYTKDPRTKLSNCIPMRLYGDGAEAQRNLGKSMGDIMSRTFKNMLCYIHADFSNAEANKSSKYSHCNFLHLPVQPHCKIGSCAIAACRNERERGYSSCTSWVCDACFSSLGC